jgi:chromosome segregation ATPase
MSETGRQQLKKRFGKYRAEDVDRLLDRLESERQQEENLFREERERWMTAQEQSARKEEEFDALKTEAERLSKECDSLRAENNGQKEKLERQAGESEKIRIEMERVRMEIEGIRTELEMAQSQSQILGNRVARQRRELEEKDRLLQEDPVGDARQKAEQIISNATEISQRMIDDAENIRTRALAAVRSAYFNAMGFRQSIEEKFISLEHDLDQSLLVLRGMETESAKDAEDFIVETVK